MKNIVFFLTTIFILNACKQNSETSGDVNIIPKTNVEITTVQYGSINDNLELLANTIYLKRNIISSPIPAFITSVYVRLGDRVKQGEILYELESKERRALGNQLIKIDTALSSFGIIKVKAQASGIVSTLNKQQTGDYVLEGTQLCTISESNDLAFQVNVPYEFIQYVKSGKSCRIILPDNSVHSAIISTPLSTMNVAAQTQTVLAKTRKPVFLPESLIVKVLVNKGNDIEKQLLPISCVQSDEMMTAFWVMQLINDSTAVKIPITTGNKNDKHIEIISPHFNVSDSIVLTGSYGLQDTALVKIISIQENGK